MPLKQLGSTHKNKLVQCTSVLKILPKEKNRLKKGTLLLDHFVSYAGQILQS